MEFRADRAVYRVAQKKYSSLVQHILKSYRDITLQAMRAQKKTKINSTQIRLMAYFFVFHMLDVSCELLHAVQRERRATD